jgi:hypothetical protein
VPARANAQYTAFSQPCSSKAAQAAAQLHQPGVMDGASGACESHRTVHGSQRGMLQPGGPGSGAAAYAEVWCRRLCLRELSFKRLSGPCSSRGVQAAKQLRLPGCDGDSCAVNLICQRVLLMLL